ncbi:MAG: hypothetical protein WCJ30_24655 [Deltaproteobacteria bacterium]
MTVTISDPDVQRSILVHAAARREPVRGVTAPELGCYLGVPTAEAQRLLDECCLNGIVDLDIETVESDRSVAYVAHPAMLAAEEGREDLAAICARYAKRRAERHESMKRTARRAAAAVGAILFLVVGVTARGAYRSTTNSRSALTVRATEPPPAPVVDRRRSTCVASRLDLERRLERLSAARVGCDARWTEGERCLVGGRLIDRATCSGDESELLARLAGCAALQRGAQ